jgi:hypothetical protein
MIEVMREDIVSDPTDHSNKIREAKDLGLTEDQLNSLNFESHTFDAIKTLVDQGRLENAQEAFLIVAELSIIN